MTQLYKPKSSVRIAETDNLFCGVLIRWQAMTVAERFVCANIVLIPLWWIVGLYQYMPLLLLLGAAVYEWGQYGELRLKRPSLPVIALFAFGAYQVVKILFSYYEPRTVGFLEVVIFSFCPAFWLWYIQSNNIRIRMQVVAWACTVSAVQMVGFWFVIQFVLPQTFFLPPHLRNLFALVTRRGAGGEYELNKVHYLVPHRPYGNLANLPRFSLFFIYPEFFGVVAAFIGLVALDIKNKLWSRLLFLASVFLILLSGTRIVWITFPIVVGLHYLFSTSNKRWGPPIIFGVIAVASFTALSLPPTADLISNALTQSAQSINEVREDSSELRFEIYKQTWEAIQDNPIWGHLTVGPAVNPNVPFGRVGSHSLILGRLLYLNGFVGTVIFIFFWISLFVWFYETRAGRPKTGFCVLILYTLVSPTLELVYEMAPSLMLILLCAAIRHPKQKFVKKFNHA